MFELNKCFSVRTFVAARRELHPNANVALIRWIIARLISAFDTAGHCLHSAPPSAPFCLTAGLLSPPPRPLFSSAQTAR